MSQPIWGCSFSLGSWPEEAALSRKVCGSFADARAWLLIPARMPPRFACAPNLCGVLA